MNDEKRDEMLDRKWDNILRELTTRLTLGKYKELLASKIIWLRSLEIKIIPVSARGAIEMEKITFGGKVTWEKGKIPKKPLSLMLNMLDFTDTRFITILLHECGHLIDKDNDSILFGTIESEISAWNHAIMDFKKLPPDDFDRGIFSAIMKDSLYSYKVDAFLIEKMVSMV